MKDLMALSCSDYVGNCKNQWFLGEREEKLMMQETEGIMPGVESLRKSEGLKRSGQIGLGDRKS